MIDVEAIVYHPRVAGLGRSLAEQQRVDAFAIDLASWLCGAPHDGLGALARVITLVARRELRGPRRLCKRRPLLAIEAGARATEALWPLIRWDEPEPPPPPEEGAGDPRDPAGAGVGAAGSSDDAESTEEGEEAEADDEASKAPEAGDDTEEGDEAESEDDTEEGDEADSDAEDPSPDGEGEDAAATEDESDVDSLLAALAELDDLDDPDLAGLADRLRTQLGAAEGADAESALDELVQGVGNVAAEGALEADQVARYLEHFTPGVGWSLAPGQLQRRLLTDLQRLTKLIEQLAELRQLADALGRLEDADRKEGRLDGGREEVVGVRMGGDVANALPSELGLLGSTATEDLFYQRFVEHRLVTLELTGSGDEGRAEGIEKGPIIACIDTSASMEGAREMAAKALVLAICRRVLPQRRVVHLVLFGGPGERTELRLRRGAGGLEALLDFLCMSFTSGTDFDGPLLRAVELLAEQDLDRADILVVTDGLGRANPEVIAAVQQAKERHQLRVWSVVLGARYTSGVQPFSDRIWAFDPSDAADAVGLLRAVASDD